MHETSILVSGQPTSGRLARHLRSAFTKAQALETRLPPRILDLNGMSGRKYRRLINNLVGSIPNARYLEVGSWAGSTACAAMHGNRAKITCIDDWSQFGGPKDTFEANVAACLNDGIDFKFIESDFRRIDYRSIGRHNVYMFDGPHRPEDQYDGLVMAQAALDREFVFIADDWNFPAVAPATFEAIAAARLRTLYSIQIRTTSDGSHPEEVYGQKTEWHNGYFLAVLRKPWSLLTRAG